MRFVRNAFVREAPYVGAAITITIDAIALIAGASDVVQTALAGITAAWVAVYVRSVSTPREAAQERVAAAIEGARNAALADVASLKPVARPKARKAVAKKP